MNINLQPSLENDRVMLRPLQENDFKRLYAVAADPLIWAQHPNKDRWKEPVFRTFFDGAMQSGGAFLIIDKNTAQAIGSTRFYDYNSEDSSILIGYTFYSTACWGKGVNSSVKALMLNYIFNYVDKVVFHVGAENIRSQIAIERISAVKMGEEQVAYFGEASKPNVIYELTKAAWQAGKSQIKFQS